MRTHISTSETFMAGGHSYSGFCPVCCKENQPLTQGYIETTCGSCKNYFSIYDPHRIVKKRRELLGLSRKEMSAQMGLNYRTIANYETVWPSKRYFVETQKLVNRLIV